MEEEETEEEENSINANRSIHSSKQNHPATTVVDVKRTAT